MYTCANYRKVDIPLKRSVQLNYGILESKGERDGRVVLRSSISEWLNMQTATIVNVLQNEIYIKVI